MLNQLNYWNIVINDNNILLLVFQLTFDKYITYCSSLFNAYEMSYNSLTF